MTLVDSFTVSSNGLCLLCLNDGNGKIVETSASRLVEYLKLDHKKIFNITSEISEVEVNHEVTMTVCKTCADTVNTFNDLFLYLEEKKKKMIHCVKNMLEVMLNAERSLLLSVPKKGNSGTGEHLEVAKTGIAHNFRKEALRKCNNMINNQHYYPSEKRYLKIFNQFRFSCVENSRSQEDTIALVK